jgi:predicted dienelactone hydrolase
MRSIAFLAVIIACFAAPMAEAAGFRFIDIPADASGPALTGAVWSPCAAPPQEIRVRFVTFPGVRNCPAAGDKLPLIVISHGSGGWFGAHHDTATTLADAGFVVAAVNHPGDNATDRSRIDTLSILLDRPADIRRLTDFMLGTWPEASKLDGQRIGFYGFSRGAYTGLAIAGGRLDISGIVPLCPEGFIDGMCAEIGRGEIPTRRPTEDRRFKAAVLADLEFGRVFTSQGLEDVKVPVQLGPRRLVAMACCPKTVRQ